MAYTRPTASAADATFLGATAYTRPAAGSADATFLSTPQAIAQAASPLGAPAVLAVQFAGWSAADTMLGAPAVVASNSLTAIVTAPTMLGTPEALALQSVAWASAASPMGAPAAYGALAASWVSSPTMLGAPAAIGAMAAGWASAPSMIGIPSAIALIPGLVIAQAPTMMSAPSAIGYHDFTVGMGDVVSRYVMDLTTPGGLVRVPISSWQATLSTGASNYVQCVVPAVAAWVASINAATAFTITRTATTLDGAPVEYEMAAAPLEQIQLSQGPTNYSATLSGYSTAFAEDEAPDAAYDRYLTGVRSVDSGSSGMRVRCAIDWLLRPAQRAYLPDSSSFIVGYINFYQPQGNDSYMDVGE